MKTTHWMATPSFGRTRSLVFLSSGLLMAAAFVTSWWVMDSAPSSEPSMAVYLPVVAVLGIVVVVLAYHGWLRREIIGHGHALIETTGAQRVQASSNDPRERLLLDIVVAMAAATRLPAPAVLVLEEPAINALGACAKPDDAAIAVTRGALQALDEDELRAMIAHELAHALQKDPRRSPLGIGLDLFMRCLPVPAHDALAKLFGKTVAPRVQHARDLAADRTAVLLSGGAAGLIGCLRKIEREAEQGHLHGTGAKALRHHWFVDDERDEDSFSGLDDLVAPCPLEARLSALRAADRA